MQEFRDIGGEMTDFPSGIFWLYPPCIPVVFGDNDYAIKLYR